MLLSAELLFALVALYLWYSSPYAKGVLEAHQAEIQLQKDEARQLCDSEAARTVGIEPQEDLRPEKVQI